MLNDIILTVIMLSVVMLNAVMLIVVMLSFVLLRIVKVLYGFDWKVKNSLDYLFLLAHLKL